MIKDGEYMSDALINDSNVKQDIKSMDTMQLMELYKKTGDVKIKWEIVIRYQHLIKYVAMQSREIYSSFAQIEDIINEGLLTLSNSVDKFDIDKGIKFETYVSKRIRGMIIDLARKQDWVPRNIRKRAKEFDEATTKLSNTLGRYPTNAEMADYLEISEEKYQKERAYIAANNVVSLEALTYSDENDNIAYQIPNEDKSIMPDFVLEEHEKKEILTKAINKLQKNEQIVVSLYYVENMLLKEIAQVMNLSEPRISQIHTRAIEKLRKELINYYNITAKSKKKEKEK